MKEELTLDNLTDEQRERTCALCEYHIIEGSSMSRHFMCEGSLCDQALPILIEEIELEEEDKLNNSTLRYKIKIK